MGLDRFELSTSRLSGVRSNQLSYRPPDDQTAYSLSSWEYCRAIGPQSGSSRPTLPGLLKPVSYSNEGVIALGIDLEFAPFLVGAETP